ncbi:hypothetical protein CDL15_Pgr015764 [Punica granatum]|uniref:R13L1/DRL21-like LRR repeat region domain-containing protein n=1 Tax=Punica granatum TaxID=22663 RepID=A0A218XPL9_PUNGR|nr:hypothetical protein CDL15_Pgr015764 [Punica granatum]
MIDTAWSLHYGIVHRGLNRICEEGWKNLILNIIIYIPASLKARHQRTQPISALLTTHPPCLHVTTFKVGEDSIRDDAAGLNELSKLTGLRKGLTIECLARVRSVPSGLEASFPIEKLALQSLELRGDHFYSKKADAEVLERLRPHPDLKKLSIVGYGGVQPSSWISQLHRLVEFGFGHYYGRVRLPPLDQLPSLKRIYLFSLSELQWIELSESESETPPSNSFPSLEEIRLESLRKFRGWERRRMRRRSSSRVGQEEEDIQEEVEEEDDDSLLMLPLFSHKVKVTIDLCPTFSYMHGQELHLKKTSTRIIKQLSRNLTSALLSSSSRITLISPSSISLLAPTGLTISEAEDLEHLPVELFQSLPSLQSLAIKDCRRLKGPPVWAILRYLTALESLTIYDCPQLDLSTGESEYQEDMPEGPTYKLRELKFRWIWNMGTLPWWIQHLTNLESLKIEFCLNLRAFPEWFPQLTSLKRLEICGEKLIRRCRRNIGEDWPKISHIPDIYVRLNLALPLELNHPSPQKEITIPSCQQKNQEFVFRCFKALVWHLVSPLSVVCPSLFLINGSATEGTG